MRRAIYRPLGALFLALASIGVVLPGLPTTPFLILAAWFFARSSERWHRRLLESELFGPMLHNWETRRCMSLRAKITALASMLLAGGASVNYALEEPVIRLLVVGLMALGCATVLSIRTCGDCGSDEAV
jgi:uncharacterized membrane protein YbaN (DUF454 family)